MLTTPADQARLRGLRETIANLHTRGVETGRRSVYNRQEVVPDHGQFRLVSKL